MNFNVRESAPTAPLFATQDAMGFAATRLSA